MPVKSCTKPTAGFLDPLLPGLLATADLFASQRDVVFFAKDLGGRYVAVNETLVERCGLARREDLIGKTVGDVFPPDLARRYATQDSEVAARGRRITERLELHLYPHRRPGWCLTSKEPLRTPEGRICGLVGISRDLQTLSSAQRIPAGLVGTLDALEADVGSIRSPIDLAKRSGLSPSRFARLIKRIFRVPPSQLLAQARAAAALRLLTETQQAIGTIAHECGYYDQSAFTRAFRATVGMTPSEIRKRRV